MLAKPEIGFVLGKFMPPHKGHVFLCEFAKNYCEHLVILVASLPDEPIPGKLRYEWMKKMFPDCTVVWTNEVLPQEPRDENDTAFWETWKQVVAEAMSHYTDDLSYPDVLFASEEYGHKLAATVHARFVPCDILRQVVPVSGTACRDDPEDKQEFLPETVKPYFFKDYVPNNVQSPFAFRVCVFGPESTGKTTLAKKLGQHYATAVVPEYGRTYTEAFGTDIESVDLQRIVHGHLATVEAAKKQSGRILIEDTDPVMTAVWSDMLIGERDPWFSSFSDHADLYLLCDVDIPWVNDGTRYFENDADRRRFFETCENELKARGVPYVIIRGDREERMERAIAAIDLAFN